MRYIKLLKEGGAAKTYVGKKEGSGENLCSPIRGGGGVKKPENSAYIVYEWSLSLRNIFLKSAFCFIKCESFVSI